MRKRKSAAASTAVRLTLIDKIVVLGTPVCLLCGALILVGYSSVRRHREQIEGRIERWQTEYHLNDDEIRRLKELEYEFHGDGFSILFRGEPSSEKVDLHKADVDDMLKK